MGSPHLWARTIVFAVWLVIAHGVAQTKPTFNLLHSFTGPDGSFPVSVAVGDGGVLYGATAFGGTITSACPIGCGTVFTATPPATEGGAWAVTVLHVFTGQNGDGANPYGECVLYHTGCAGLTVGQGGVLYGITANGGIVNSTCPNGCGVVFELAPPAPNAGEPWTETILHSFTGENGDGAYPNSTMAIGKDGELYGTTVIGGTPYTSCNSGCGTVFKLIPPSRSSEAPGGSGRGWTEVVLHRFTGEQDGNDPLGVVLGRDGVLYGTTWSGGERGWGNVFALSPPGSGGDTWTAHALYSFSALSGGDPASGVVIGDDGRLFGTTSNGGLGGCPFGCGTAFEVVPPVASGGHWSGKILLSFSTGNFPGFSPSTGFVEGKGGVLYGATTFGAINSLGTVFALLPPSAAGGNWVATMVHNFSIPSTDGAYPTGLAIGKDGILYGTASGGGILNNGTLFQITP